jgi:hypothetical protein
MPRAPERVSAPPASEVNIRSLDSDLASLKASGGVSPSPKTFSFTPETVSQLTGEGVVSEPKLGQGKKILKIVLSIAAVIGLGLVGYFIIYPLLFPAPSPEIPPAEQTPPPAEVVRVPHQSLFVTPPPLRAEIFLSSLSLGDIIVTLQSEAQLGAAPGTLKELAISNDRGQVLFSQYITTLAPSLSASDVASVVEEDFTSFLYYNDKGVWPGYVAKLKAAVAPSYAEQVFVAVEGSDIRSFYVADPGISQGFKTGPYKGAPVRFAAFSQPGASFNYGVIGDYVIFSASFDGFKTAVEYLGL